jgi:hypothetical protein
MSQTTQNRTPTAQNGEKSSLITPLSRYQRLCRSRELANLFQAPLGHAGINTTDNQLSTAVNTY